VCRRLVVYFPRLTEVCCQSSPAHQMASGRSLLFNSRNLDSTSFWWDETNKSFLISGTRSLRVRATMIRSALEWHANSVDVTIGPRSANVNTKIHFIDFSTKDKEGYEQLASLCRDLDVGVLGE
jgi:hypothetical protein